MAEHSQQDNLQSAGQYYQDGQVYPQGYAQGFQGFPSNQGFQANQGYPQGFQANPQGYQPNAQVPYAQPGAQPTQFASSSIYVGDLQPEVSEADLYRFFTPIGPVVSVRVCRDYVTRRSLGYGYVNFQNHQDAERAIDVMNFQLLNGRPCRIMWVQRDPSARRSGVGNIFIKGLDPQIDSATLYDTFSKLGEVLSCKVATYPDGTSKGYGFVHFNTAQAAEDAINMTNGKLIGNSVVTVQHFLRPADRSSIQQFTNLYVKHFPVDWNESNLRGIFSDYGNITSMFFPLADGRPKGYAFVNIDSTEAAKKAIDELHNTYVVGQDEHGVERTLYVQRAQSRRERDLTLRKYREQRRQEREKQYSGSNLYIKHLEINITDQGLRDHFKDFGNIVSARVMRDQHGVSKGFGFVCFDNPASATRAISEMHGKPLEGKPLYVSLAQSREERRARNEARFQYMMNPQNMYRPTMYPQYPPMMFGHNMMPPQSFQDNSYRQPMQRTNQGMQRRNPRQHNNRGGRGYPSNRNRQPRPYAENDQVHRSQTAPENQDLARQLVNMTREQQQSTLGNILYPAIAKNHPEEAGKITGMLLALDNSELLEMVENPAILQEKVNEALQVLVEHSQARDQTQSHQ